MIIDMNGTADLADLRIVDIRWNSSGSRKNSKCLFLVAPWVFVRLAQLLLVAIFLQAAASWRPAGLMISVQDLGTSRPGLRSG